MVHAQSGGGDVYWQPGDEKLVDYICPNSNVIKEY